MPLHVGIGNATGRLRQTNRGPEWRCTAEELGKPPQVLRGSGEQDLVPRAAQATQSKPIEPEDALLFPLAVITYVLLKDANESASRIIKLEPGRVITITIACVLAVTAGLTWVVAAGYLPSLYIDATRQTPFVQYFAGAMWLLNAIAIVLLFVRRRTILDVWLIVAVFVAIPDLGLAFLYPVVRFSVGWYMAKSRSKNLLSCLNRL